ncbi:MAG: hypothetical protein ACKVY0_10225 [Prosthecobacter sp.]|uniref:hypothetical protein n=1 Tax=Prosthecobacter sp. TaxID=1965333 RepID=UPI0038FF38D8
MLTADSHLEEDRDEECHESAFDALLRRQFGDEIARVSRLPLDERYRYVAWMIDNGRKHGVKHVREPRGVTL